MPSKLEAAGLHTAPKVQLNCTYGVITAYAEKFPNNLSAHLCRLWGTTFFSSSSVQRTVRAA